jgi:hypothetical protein
MLRFALAVGLAVAAPSGCNAPNPNIREGNADSVEIAYGGDLATAWPLARKHCAQYERVPRLAETGTGAGDNGIDLASFECIRP